MTLPTITAPASGVPTLISAGEAARRLPDSCDALAVDTERATGVKYYDRAFLIQLRARGGEPLLIDPLMSEKPGWEALAAKASCEWIIHSSRQDLPYLADVGLTTPTLFDTALAAQLLGMKHISLQAVVEDIVGVHLNKEESDSDWTLRPLTERQRAYAALDVEYLHQIRDALWSRAEELGRTEWIRQECATQLAAPPPEPKKDPWRVYAKRADISNDRALEILHQFWMVRDEIGRRRDVHPSTVVRSIDLAYAAKRLPALTRDIRIHLPGKPSLWADALAAAWAVPEDELPPVKLPRPRKPAVDGTIHRCNERLKQAATRLGEQYEINPALILTAATRHDVSLLRPRTTSEYEQALTECGARPWQIELLISALAQSWKLPRPGKGA